MKPVKTRPLVIHCPKPLYDWLKRRARMQMTSSGDYAVGLLESMANTQNLALPVGDKDRYRAEVDL